MSDDSMTFTENESKVLVTIYQNPGWNSTFALNHVCGGTFSVGTPEEQKAFRDTMNAIEGLVVKGLIDGEQMGSGEAMYYQDLKLSRRGRQEAIKERNRQTDLKQGQEALDRFADQIKRAADKEATTKPHGGGNPQTHDVGGSNN